MAGASGPARPIPTWNPLGGPVKLYVLRLCAKAWPRSSTPSSAGGTRFPQVAGAARPARLVAGKRRAAAALIVRIVWARFPFVRRLSVSSSPNLVARVDDRRLPLMCAENRACFGGECMLISSIAGEQPQLCRSAHGDPSNRSLRSKGRHSDGNATAPPDSAAVPVVFLRCYVFATHTRLCGCAGLSYPSHSTSPLPQPHGSEIHDANETRPCSFTLAQVAYWYEPAVCATTSIKP